MCCNQAGSPVRAQQLPLYSSPCVSFLLTESTWVVLRPLCVSPWLQMSLFVQSWVIFHFPDPPPCNKLSQCGFQAQPLVGAGTVLLHPAPSPFPGLRVFSSVGDLHAHTRNMPRFLLWKTQPEIIICHPSPLIFTPVCLFFLNEERQTSQMWHFQTAKKLKSHSLLCAVPYSKEVANSISHLALTHLFYTLF